MKLKSNRICLTGCLSLISCDQFSVGDTHTHVHTTHTQICIPTLQTKAISRNLVCTYSCSLINKANEVNNEVAAFGKLIATVLLLAICSYAHVYN